ILPRLLDGHVIRPRRQLARLYLLARLALLDGRVAAPFGVDGDPDLGLGIDRLGGRDQAAGRRELVAERRRVLVALVGEGDVLLLAQVALARFLRRIEAGLEQIARRDGAAPGGERRDGEEGGSDSLHGESSTGMGRPTR